MHKPSKNSLDDLYKAKELDASQFDDPISVGRISDKEKFTAAKQILLGLAVLYIITIAAYLYNPEDGSKLIDIAITVFPPLATLILVAYFRDKGH